VLSTTWLPLLYRLWCLRTIIASRRFPSYTAVTLPFATCLLLLAYASNRLALRRLPYCHIPHAPRFHSPPRQMAGPLANWSLPPLIHGAPWYCRIRGGNGRPRSGRGRRWRACCGGARKRAGTPAWQAALLGLNHLTSIAAISYRTPLITTILRRRHIALSTVVERLLRTLKRCLSTTIGMDCAYVAERPRFAASSCYTRATARRANVTRA